MENGPTGGDPANVKDGNAILVGLDPVAMDAWAFEHLLERSGRLPGLPAHGRAEGQRPGRLRGPHRGDRHETPREHCSPDRPQPLVAADPGADRSRRSCSSPLFVLAVWATWTSRLGGYPVSGLLEMDPLVLISTVLATGYVYSSSAGG